jgi:hypothetical protein
MKAEERRLEKAQERSAHWRRWGEDGLAGISDNHQRLCPTGSHRLLNLWEVAAELSRGLVLLLQDGDGRCPICGTCERFQQAPHWRDLILFHEHFHGDEGRGIGASHQTGTALVARLIEQSGE